MAVVWKRVESEIDIVIGTEVFRAWPIRDKINSLRRNTVCLEALQQVVAMASRWGHEKEP